MNQFGKDDPMRYVLDPGEQERAYEQAPPCHHPSMTIPLGQLMVVRSAEEE